MRTCGPGPPAFYGAFRPGGPGCYSRLPPANPSRLRLLMPQRITGRFCARRVFPRDARWSRSLPCEPRRSARPGSSRSARTPTPLRQPTRTRRAESSASQTGHVRPRPAVPAPGLARPRRAAGAHRRAPSSIRRVVRPPVRRAPRPARRRLRAGDLSPPRTRDRRPGVAGAPGTPTGELSTPGARHHRHGRRSDARHHRPPILFTRRPFLLASPSASSSPCTTRSAIACAALTPH